MRSPAPARGAERDQMLPCPAAIPSTTHAEHRRASTAWHSPGTAPAQPRHSQQRPMGQLPGAIPRAVEQPAGAPGPPAALRQHLHSHESKGLARHSGPMDTSLRCHEKTGTTPRFIFLLLSLKHPELSQVAMLRSQSPQSDTPPQTPAHPPPAPRTEKGQKPKKS